MKSTDFNVKFTEGPELQCTVLRAGFMRVKQDALVHLPALEHPTTNTRLVELQPKFGDAPAQISLIKPA